MSITTAVIGFAVKDGAAHLAYVAFIPIVIFWLLDGYYLALERSFRAAYNRLAAHPPDATWMEAEIASPALAGWDILSAVVRPAALSVYLVDRF